MLKEAGSSRWLIWSQAPRDEHGVGAQPPDRQAILEYLNNVGADLRYWYRAAETKAQLVLTVNGRDEQADAISVKMDARSPLTLGTAAAMKILVEVV